MASEPGILLRPSAPDESAPEAPYGGSRVHLVQRLQVGLVGLGAMVLLVGLASVIITNRQQNEAQVVPEAAAPVGPVVQAPPASDPLVDAGVVPDLPIAPPPTASASDAVPPQP